MTDGTKEKIAYHLGLDQVAQAVGAAENVARRRWKERKGVRRLTGVLAAIGVEGKDVLGVPKTIFYRMVKRRH